MRRFSLLFHETDSSHYDLLFEEKGKDDLLTLRLEPGDLDRLKQGEKILASILPRHRKKYLDYEGEISHDRGYVEHVDYGTWEPEGTYRILKGTLLSGRMLMEFQDHHCQIHMLPK
jgi:hypothetical protein